MTRIYKAPVKVEALRLARNVVKRALREHGILISHVSAVDITKAAKRVLAAMPELHEQALDNLDRAKANPIPHRTITGS